MANVNVAYGQLTDVANTFGSGQTDIEGTLSELKGAVEGLISASVETGYMNCTHRRDSPHERKPAGGHASD